MAADSKRFDNETSAMLFEGASLSQLSRMFCHDNRKTKEKLFGLQPKGMRAGSPVYDIAEAAQYLVTPILPVDEWIRRMKASDLPTDLSKEFWAGQRSKQLYEEQAGDLWRTELVQDHIMALFKVLAMSLRLASDTVDREVGITPAQRGIITRIMDDTLARLHEEVARTFTDKPVSQEAAVVQSADDEL